MGGYVNVHGNDFLHVISDNYFFAAAASVL